MTYGRFVRIGHQNNTNAMAKIIAICSILTVFFFTAQAQFSVGKAEPVTTNGIHSIPVTATDTASSGGLHLLPDPNVHKVTDEVANNDSAKSTTDSTQKTTAAHRSCDCQRPKDQPMIVCEFPMSHDICDSAHLSERLKGTSWEDVRYRDQFIAFVNTQFNLTLKTSTDAIDFVAGRFGRVEYVWVTVAEDEYEISYRDCKDSIVWKTLPSKNADGTVRKYPFFTYNGVPFARGGDEKKACGNFLRKKSHQSVPADNSNIASNALASLSGWFSQFFGGGFLPTIGFIVCFLAGLLFLVWLFSMAWNGGKRQVVRKQPKWNTEHTYEFVHK